MGRRTANSIYSRGCRKRGTERLEPACAVDIKLTAVSFAIIWFRAGRSSVAVHLARQRCRVIGEGLELPGRRCRGGEFDGVAGSPRTLREGRARQYAQAHHQRDASIQHGNTSRMRSWTRADNCKCTTGSLARASKNKAEEKCSMSICVARHAASRFRLRSSLIIRKGRSGSLLLLNLLPESE